MPEIFVLSGSSVGRSFAIESGATIGRSPDCSIQLKDRSISRKHAHLEEADGDWYLCDDGSRNGVAIGDQKHERVALPDGQEFLCGEVLMRFRTGATVPEPGAGSTVVIAPRPGAAAAPEVAHDAAEEVEIELSAGGGFVAPRSPAPAVPASAPADEGEDGISFEDADDIDLAAPQAGGPGLDQTEVNPRVAPPAPVSPDAKKVGLGPPSRERLAEQRGRVLQYHRVPDSNSMLSFELSQLPAWKRYALYLVAFLVLAGVFGATVFGTSFLKGKVAGPDASDASPGGE